MNTVWTASFPTMDEYSTKAEYLGPLELEDAPNCIGGFEILATDKRLIFGGVCNVGFLESGYMELEEYETLEEAISELVEELTVYYTDGPRYVSRIVCNERM